MSEPPAIPENEPQRNAQNGGARTAGSKAARLLNNRTAIFLMLFCVTGFLGIPFLCKSQAFTRTEKIFWSIVVTIYTSLLICGTASVVWWSYSRIRETLG